MNTSLEVFRSLSVFKALAFLVLLLLYDVELGFDAFTAYVLLGSCQGLELMCVRERVPARSISIQNVLHALILDLH